jgi:hypothetical protein
MPVMMLQQWARSWMGSSTVSAGAVEKTYTIPNLSATISQELSWLKATALTFLVKRLPMHHSHLSKTGTCTNLQADPIATLRICMGLIKNLSILQAIEFILNHKTGRLQPKLKQVEKFAMHDVDIGNKGAAAIIKKCVGDIVWYKHCLDASPGLGIPQLHPFIITNRSK